MVEGGRGRRLVLCRSRTCMSLNRERSGLSETPFNQRMISACFDASAVKAWMTGTTAGLSIVIPVGAFSCPVYSAHSVSGCRRNASSFSSSRSRVSAVACSENGGRGALRALRVRIVGTGALITPAEKQEST
jgi:hypothetical protein